MLTSNKDYQRPDDDSITYRLGLVRAWQVVAILGESIVYNDTLLTKSIHIWRQNSVWFSRAKILIVVEAKKQHAKDIASKIISEFWKQTKSPFVVVVVSHEHQVSFFKYKPYSPGCEIKPRFVGQWKKEGRLFQNYRYLNLNKCVLTGAPAVMEPFVFPPINNTYCEGIEIRIFETLSTHLNFTINYQEIPGENPWLSSINGTPTGMIGQLYRQEADITISGSRLTYERAQFADSLDTYFSDDFTWIGPAARTTPSWKAVFLVFRVRMWISLGVCYVFSIIVFFLLYFRKRHAAEDISHSFVVMCGANLNIAMPLSYITSKSVIRIFFASYLCFALTINAIYTSGLYEVLSQGLKLDLIDSARAGLDKGLTVSIDETNIISFPEIMPEFYNEMVNKGLLDLDIDYYTCLERAAKYGDCMVLYPSLVARYDINNKYTLQSGEQLVHIMKTRYKTYEPVMYMPKHHPLIPVFRKKMRQLVESGWVRHQINTIMEKSKRNGRQNTGIDRLYGERRRKELTIDQLLGAFLVSLVTMIISLVIFIGEIVYHNYSPTRVIRIRNELKKSDSVEMRKSRMRQKLLVGVLESDFVIEHIY